MPLLTPTERAALAREQSEWTIGDAEISREYRFTDFLSAIQFVNRLATEAEAAGHHPDIDIRYNRVRLALTTHDEGGLTKKDRNLAIQADRIFCQMR